ISNNTVAEVLGYLAIGDKGGGIFYYDSSSSATNDNGTIISPDSPTTGRWIRIYDTDEVDVRWFGILPDSTDYYSEINALLNLTYIKEIVFDYGDYTIGSGHTITVPSGKKLIFRN